MPLARVANNELPFLYEKLFHPFHKANTDHDMAVNHDFEYIRTHCKYYKYTINKPSCSQDSEKLFVLHLNIRSLLSTEKYEALNTFLYMTGIQWDVICISETWLNSDSEKYRNIEGYTAFFHNRVGRTGGGAAVYVRTTSVISTTRMDLECPIGSESVILQCCLPCSKLIIAQLYRPPNTCPALFCEEISAMFDTIDMLSNTVIVTGDFNFDLCDSSSDSELFFNTMLSYGFLPLISLPTRQSETRLSLLDNIYCNNISLVHNSGIIHDDISDHFPIYMTLKTAKSHNTTTKKPVTSFNYNNIASLQDHLQSDLHDILHVTDPNIACDRIIQSYTDGIRKFSRTYVPTRKNTPIKPWITPAILASITRKNELFFLKNKERTEENNAPYRKYQNMLVGVIREAKKAYIQAKLKNSDAKETWNIIKELTTHCTESNKLPDTFRTSTGLVQGTREVAEGFNSYFTSIGAELKRKINYSTQDPLKYVPNYIGTTLNQLQRTDENEIRTIVNNMRNVGSGHDRINTRIFKHTFTSIIDIIVHFMNLCLKQSTFPTLLKRAVIKPIYKTGDKQLFNNYRPISLLSVISKVLEKLIYIRLQEHLNTNKLICDNQFGFRTGMSTYMPIAVLQERIVSAFEMNSNICGIYLDLRKAFDSVDIRILLGKLQKYGICKEAHMMLKSYLSERTQCVQINDIYSSDLPINIGVPQGSILGPLLFILYVNDFPLICGEHATTLMYADDTAIFIEGDNEQLLQSRLDTLMPKVDEWFSSNQLSLNTDKTYYQIYTHQKKNFELKITLSGASIDRTKSIKYLGVFIDEDMKWKTHISKLQTILSRNVGIMSRLKYFLDSKQLLLIYNSLFLSHVNYCCLIYSNTYPSYLNGLVKLQKRALRLIDKQPRLAHTAPIFKKLKLLRIKDIGLQQMLLLLHRKLKGNLPTIIDDLFLIAHPSRTNRNLKHFKEILSYRVYKDHTVTWTGPRLWNKVMVPFFPTLSSVPPSKYTIKRLSKLYFVDQYE